MPRDGEMHERRGWLVRTVRVGTQLRISTPDLDLVLTYKGRDHEDHKLQIWKYDAFRTLVLDYQRPSCLVEGVWLIANRNRHASVSLKAPKHLQANIHFHDPKEIHNEYR